MNPVTGTGRTSVDIGGDANLELVDKFCYSGDMLSVDIIDSEREIVQQLCAKQYVAWK